MNARLARESETGFTLVELVSIIALVAILLAAFQNRVAERDAFDQRLGAESLISLVLSAQQAALGRENVQFKLAVSGSNVLATTVVGGVTTSTRTFPNNQVAVTAGAVGSGTGCGAINSPLTLNFTNFGEIESVDDDGFPICLNGQSSLCISPSGFAHQGACL